jgi:hypothetical protein
LVWKISGHAEVKRKIAGEEVGEGLPVTGYLFPLKIGSSLADNKFRTDQDEQT